ncbi:diguanylate cyclase domain-containing protein [Dokdonella sp.]|uniref:ligand-binding sensor domain-containing diguanylate cyclase n=1 Tax=Dokdonella sp. TaxID=2291710 RepID=UPI003783C5C2
MLKISTTVVSLLCLIGSSFAAEPAPPAAPQALDLFDLGAPSFTNFSPRDGVPETVTVATATDREGFVWLASPAGVFRYDGRRWEPSGDASMAHPADSLALDAQGTLWAAFRDDGLAHYDGTRWHVEDRRSGLPSQQIRRFAQMREADGSATLWAVTWDQGVMLRRDGRWMLDPDNAQLPQGAILSMAQTFSIGRYERQWVGSGNDGLWFRERRPGVQSAWQRFRAPGFDPAQVEYLLATGQGGHEALWISVFGAGVWRLSDEGLRHWSKEGGELPTNDVYDIARTPLPNGDHAIWVSSRSGLVRINGDHAQAFDRRHGLPSDVVRGLSAWRSPNGDEVLWLATEAGVSRTIIGANGWLTASLMGAHATGVFSVLVEPDGHGQERLWVGASDDGIGLYEQGRWRTFTAANGALPVPTVRLIKAAADEHGERTLWVGQREGYLLRVREGPVFETIDTPWNKSPGESVTALLTRTVEGRYEQWVGTRQSGAYRLRDGQWSAIRAGGAVEPSRIGTLVEQIDAQGHSWIWATTNQGLARFDRETWTLFGRDAGLPDLELIDATLIADAQGRPILWMGTSNSGIARADLSDPQHPRVLPADLPPPPDPNAYSALSDSQGRIYVCTNNGVQQLTPIEGGYASRVFTRTDGMIHDECNTNGQFIDAHDRYWTGTLGGLIVYDPQRAARDESPKALKLIGAYIDDHRVDGGTVHVDPSTHEVRIEFALLSWQREGESRFRTQLLGYEARPGEWTAQNTRTFNALPPGHYVLRIEARDYAGNLSTPIQLPIEMAARWWQQTWARAAGAIALLLLGYAIVRWRTHALHMQRQALESRVDQRTHELADANARLLELSYVDALTGLANRRRLLETLEHGPHADGGARAALIYVDVDYFKDYNDRYGHPAGDEALRRVASVMRACAPPGALLARYGGEEFACLLPDADLAAGVALAERFRRAIAAFDVPIPGSDLTQRVTISAGVASARLCSSADAHRLLRNADQALYQAKHDGRDRVRAASDSPADPATSPS